MSALAVSEHPRDLFLDAASDCCANTRRATAQRRALDSREAGGQKNDTVAKAWNFGDSTIRRIDIGLGNKVVIGGKEGFDTAAQDSHIRIYTGDRSNLDFTQLQPTYTASALPRTGARAFAPYSEDPALFVLPLPRQAATIRGTVANNTASRASKPTRDNHHHEFLSR